MGARDEVLLEYRSIQPHSTLTSQLCPQCHGGRSREHSMSVGHTGEFLWWRCHRASCGWTGREDRAASSSTYKEKHDVVNPTFIQKPLPSSLLQMFKEKYSLDEGTLDRARWSYTPDYDGQGPRVIIPILSPAGVLRGRQFRSYEGHRIKALSTRLDDGELIGWYRWRRFCRKLVLVEDAVSAIRLAAAGIDTVSLFGTGMNVERAMEINRQEYGKVIVSLDNDATSQAVRHVHRYQNYINNFVMRALHKDIKDMTPDELNGYIQTL